MKLYLRAPRLPICRCDVNMQARLTCCSKLHFTSSVLSECQQGKAAKGQRRDAAQYA